MISRCEGGCEAAFDCGGDNDHCSESDCSLLRDAGWKPVWVRVFMELDGLRDGEDEHLLGRGGWICPACIEKFARR